MDIDRRSVEEVLAEIVATKDYRQIKSRSEEDLLKLANQVEEQSQLERETAKIERDALFDRGLETTLKDIGITLPFKRLPALDGKATVLVGVSGCGKSRTCIDIGSNRLCLYFEGEFALDFNWAIQLLKTSKLTEDDFETLSCELFRCVFLARMLLLGALGVESNPRRATSFQKARSFQAVAMSLAGSLFKNTSTSDILARFNQLSNKYVLIFDEAQVYLTLFEKRYRNSDDKYRRPLLRFLVHFVHVQCAASSVWCGTQLSLKDISFFVSGAGGGKSSDVQVFTDFHYYTYEQIKQLLPLFLRRKKSKNLAKLDPNVIHEACFWLQGRARLLMAFLGRLGENFNNPFKTALDNYVEDMTCRMIEMQSFKWWWSRALAYPTKIEDLDTKEPAAAPDAILLELMREYLFARPDKHHRSISTTYDGDLVKTALVSLRAENHRNRYFLAEPLVFEAGLNYFQHNTRAMERFMKMCVDPIVRPLSAASLNPSARGTELEKFIALRFRLGWWKDIERDSVVWQEIPPLFRERFQKLTPPSMIACEGSVDDKLLEDTFCRNDASKYVLPANKIGPDGWFNFIGLFLKGSFSEKNADGDFFVGSEPRKENLRYTDLSEWFPGLAKREKLIQRFKELKNNQPVLLLLLEYPFCCPFNEQKPPVTEVKGDYVLHVDLSSGLSYYLLGDYAFKEFSKLGSNRQQNKVWRGAVRMRIDQ